LIDRPDLLLILSDELALERDIAVLARERGLSRRGKRGGGESYDERKSDPRAQRLSPPFSTRV
jgi:hypothetical protein